MDTDLKTSLQNLHVHLSRSGPVDAELEQLLQQLDGDIRQLLAKRAAAQAGPASLVPADVSTSYGLAERTQDISAKFAAKHPKLEPALRELGNILSNMGI